MKKPPVKFRGRLGTHQSKWRRHRLGSRAEFVNGEEFLHHPCVGIASNWPSARAIARDEARPA
jgi:hypothetical protein